MNNNTDIKNILQMLSCINGQYDNICKTLDTLSSRVFNLERKLQRDVKKIKREMIDIGDDIRELKFDVRSIDLEMLNNTYITLRHTQE